MPTLVLRNAARIPLTTVEGTRYFRLGAHPHAYLHDDDMELHKAGDDVTLTSVELDGQVTRYLSVGGLTLARGITRQHPLFYEISRMGVLAPLGVGELPDWATNKTRFIPFGPDLASAQGIAIGRAGMGPGDSLQMVADYPAVHAVGGNIQVGLTIEATVRIGTGIAFYNAGEIQIRGPLHTGLTVTAVNLPVADCPAVPAGAATAAYSLEHGGLRHRRTIAALTAHTDARLTTIRGIEDQRRLHAQSMFEMRTAVSQSTGGPIEDLSASVRVNQRPGRRDNANFRNYLDSSVNREAHDAYVAAVTGGSDAVDARRLGQRAAMQWIVQVVTVYDTHEVALFPPGWDA